MEINAIKDTSLNNEFCYNPTEFIFKEGRVQGAKTAKNGNKLLVDEATRFKLYNEGKDLIKILKGNGHFKWKRGELDFKEGDCFEINSIDEYEVNGAEKFLVIRK